MELGETLRDAELAMARGIAYAVPDGVAGGLFQGGIVDGAVAV